MSWLGYVTCHDSLSKIILQGTSEVERRRVGRRTGWTDSVKEWTSLSMARLFSNRRALSLPFYFKTGGLCPCPKPVYFKTGGLCPCPWPVYFKTGGLCPCPWSVYFKTGGLCPCPWPVYFKTGGLCLCPRPVYFKLGGLCPCPCQHSSQWPPAERTGRSLLNYPSCLLDDLIGQGTELN